MTETKGHPAEKAPFWLKIGVFSLFLLCLVCFQREPIIFGLNRCILVYFCPFLVCLAVFLVILVVFKVDISVLGVNGCFSGVLV